MWLLYSRFWALGRDEELFTDSNISSKMTPSEKPQHRPLLPTDPDGGNAMYVVAPYARDMGWASSWTSPRPERPVLGRLVALAKASAEALVGWLSGSGKAGKISGGWKHAFRCGWIPAVPAAVRSFALAE